MPSDPSMGRICMHVQKGVWLARELQSKGTERSNVGLDLPTTSFSYSANQYALENLLIKHEISLTKQVIGKIFPTEQARNIPRLLYLHFPMSRLLLLLNSLILRVVSLFYA